MTGYWENVVLSLERNEKGRDFVCGDIHGCFSYLEECLKEIGFDKENDRLFCVGDLIDRGPESHLATAYLKMSWFYSVLGNHEEMFIKAWIGNNEERRYYYRGHMDNGGEWSKTLNDEERKELIKAVDKLPLIIQIGSVIIVHAVLPAVKSLDRIKDDPHKYLETALWERDTIPPVLIKGISHIYVGHNIVIEPMTYGITTNIDTGANRKLRGKEGKFTILEIGVQNE